MSYRLHDPPWQALMVQAARLRRLDDAAVSAAPDRAKAQAQRLADKERAHAAAAALPASWRSRDKTKSPVWPAPGDLELWKAIGASHALALLAPSIKKTNNPEPFRLAYTQGYTAIQGAYMMPNTQPEPSIGQNIVALAASRHQLTEADLGNYMLDGDVTALPKNARAQVLVAMARHVGLDPLERPFMLMNDGKKVVIYARAACSDALCRTRKISTELVSVEEREVCGTRQIVARARATVIELELLKSLCLAGVDPATALKASTRTKTAVGCVAIEQPNTEWKETSTGKKYKEVLGWRDPDPAEASNLWMKATTKAERRSVIKLSGLGGISDESEIETIDVASNGQHYSVEQVPDDYIEPEADDLPEPMTCSGDAQPIADSIRARRVAVAKSTGKTFEDVYRSVLSRIGAPAHDALPEPETLLISVGKAANEVLRKWIEHLDSADTDADPADPTDEDAP